MSFQKFDESTKQPKIYCNCSRHYSCENCQPNECTCVHFYMHEVQDELIRNVFDEPFFCDQCIYYLKNDQYRSWKFQGRMDRVLFDEYKQCIKVILENHLIQLAFNQFLLKKYRVSKKLQKIFEILQNEAEIITGGKGFTKFLIYCENRESLMCLGLKRRNSFYSQLIQEGKIRFQEFIAQNFFDVNSPPLFEFKISPKHEKINYSYQQGLFLMYYLQDQLLYVDIYTDNGTQIKSLRLPKLVMEGVIPTMELLISSDKKYLTVLVNNFDFITYNLEDGNFQNFNLEAPYKDSKLFFSEGKICLWADSKVWKLNESRLKFYCFHHFQEKIHYQIGSYFHSNKKFYLFMFASRLHLQLQLLNLTLTNQNIIRNQCIRMQILGINEKISPSLLQVAEVNDTMFYIIQQKENYKIVQYSFQINKKIRKINQPYQYEDMNTINLFLLSNSSRLAFAQNSVISIFSLLTGDTIVRLVSNEFNQVIDQVFMIFDQTYIFRSGIQKIEGWKLNIS